MESQKPKSRRHFTEAARAAAIQGRRCKREEAAPRGASEVYVVRLPDACLQFGWEIRRFGAIVLHRGDRAYPTPSAARSAGLTALSHPAVPR